MLSGVSKAKRARWQMGNVLLSFDYGRRAEYLTSVILSPYAITVPIRGHDDRVESDFLCVGLEEKDNRSLVPDLTLLFWVQTKSQSGSPNKIEISSPSIIQSVLSNKMPYFIAIVDPGSSPPTLSLYHTSERVAFRHLYPNVAPDKMCFIPGPPVVPASMYGYDQSESLATIYMGEPFLRFEGIENLDRSPAKWRILKDRIEMDYWNFIYATAGLGCYRRTFPRNETKIFFPESGELTSNTLESVNIALGMLNRTHVQKKRDKDPDSDVVKAMDILMDSLGPPEPASSTTELHGSPAPPEE